MFGLHLVAFWLSLIAYFVEAGFQLAGITPRSAFRSALFAGLIVHVLFLSLRWAISGRAPMAGLFESLTVFSFCSALSAFLLCGTQETRPAWKPLSLLVAIPQAGKEFTGPRRVPRCTASPRFPRGWCAGGDGRDGGRLLRHAGYLPRGRAADAKLPLFLTEMPG